jgi:hypothetical protein
MRYVFEVLDMGTHRVSESNEKRLYAFVAKAYEKGDIEGNMGYTFNDILDLLLKEAGF